jgi:hypothetical protein
MSTKKGRDLASILGNLDDDLPIENSKPADPSPAPVREPAAEKIVPINFLITPADRKRLRQLSLDTGLSLQKLGHEAWNALLKERGLAPLEPVTANVPSGRLRRG